MPYVEQYRRPELNDIVEMMKQVVIKADGDLNYILFKYFKESIVMKGRMGYNICKNYMGELNESAEEIRRVFLGPYEDLKRDENGDV
jgi:hypothetical protein